MLTFQVVPYPCIRSFSFTKYTLIILDQRLTAHVLARVRISRAPVYSDVLKLGRERKGALLLDIGCACAFIHHLHVYRYCTPRYFLQLDTMREKLHWMVSLSSKLLYRM